MKKTMSSLRLLSGCSQGGDPLPAPRSPWCRAVVRMPRPLFPKRERESESGWGRRSGAKGGRKAGAGRTGLAPSVNGPRGLESRKCRGPSRSRESSYLSRAGQPPGRPSPSSRALTPASSPRKAFSTPLPMPFRQEVVFTMGSKAA